MGKCCVLWVEEGEVCAHWGGGVLSRVGSEDCYLERGKNAGLAAGRVGQCWGRWVERGEGRPPWGSGSECRMQGEER